MIDFLTKCDLEGDMWNSLLPFGADREQCGEDIWRVHFPSKQKVKLTVSWKIVVPQINTICVCIYDSDSKESAYNAQVLGSIPG